MESSKPELNRSFAGPGGAVATPADGAVEVDTTGLTLDEVVSKVKALVL